MSSPRPTVAGLGAEEDEGPLGRRLDARVGYGLGAFDDRWTATPQLGLDLGWRLVGVRASHAAFAMRIEAPR